MRSILAISGSASSPSSNESLLMAIAAAFPAKGVSVDRLLRTLPLYRPELDQNPLPQPVVQWREQAAKADAILIATPEYLHNMPAVLKNGLEWMKSSGEFFGKPVLPITFAPHPPRGEYAMQSLRNSLQALEARIAVELPLFQNALAKTEDGSYLLEGEAREWIEAGLEML